MKTPPISKFRLAAIGLAFLSAVASAGAADVLKADAPILLPGTKGKFDFIQIDSARRRLLAAHTGNGTLDVVSLDEDKLLKSVATGAAQDSADAPDLRQYLVSVSKPPQVSFVDAESLAVTGAVPLEGPADLLAYHAASHRAYVAHDDAKELWIVDLATKRVSGKVTLPGEGPEDLAFDEAGKRLFQAIKLADSLAVIDLKENKVSAKWPTAPARLPHGIALIPEAHAIAIAGGNGQLVLMSQADGKILASAEMPEKVDEIAYDREWHRLYCASALGKLAVFQVGTESLEKVAEVTTSPGAKSVAVDPKTHRVWIAFVKSDECYVQPFTAVSH